jgi:tripartite-type tricarboxylate transporter receptor subunit TctC
MRFLAFLAMLMALFVGPVHAQTDSFPSKPITMIVPWPAGGQTDMEVRSLSKVASRYLGQSIVIMNKPGAAGSLGAASLATAAADGYTVSSIPVGVFRQPQMTKMAFDPMKDLTYIIGTSGYTFGVVVRSDSQWKTFKELLDYAKANPGKLRYATLGVGSTQHVTMQKIANQLGIDWLHVPHKGTAENNLALQSGYVDFTADGSGWAGMVDSGKFRLLNTWGDARTKKWPDVPTLKELGFAIVEKSPYGIAGPKGLPLNIIEKLHEAFKKAVHDPEHRKALEFLNQEIVYMTPKEFTQFAAKQMDIQKGIIDQFNLRQN